MNCELCTPSNEIILWNGPHCRVILVNDDDYPGFCRVIWNSHVKEMTDLAPDARNELMRVVFASEIAVREVMQPEKINLASLGNMTPHLHWHVIPRYKNDRHFPSPIWAAPMRDRSPNFKQDMQNRLTAAIKQHLNAPVC